MTQLLISVKNVEEAQIAMYAGADLIDLKAPDIGALGALAPDMVAQIVEQVNGKFLISATVGEGHESVDALVQDIKTYAALGPDVIKMAVSQLFYHASFYDELVKLTALGIKLVAVFFADEILDFELVPKLKQVGFYGAMLDTQKKHVSLIESQQQQTLSDFVCLCESHHLFSGLAGSVNQTHIALLSIANPSFIGMRGGVCEGQKRTLGLSSNKVLAAKQMLLSCNKHKGERLKSA